MSHLVKSYICETCNICCSGPENYLQHKASAKHQKKEQQHKLGSGLPGVSGDSGTSAAQPFPGLSFHCEVCQTSMTGPESQDAHMKGAPHAKKLGSAKPLTCTLCNLACYAQENYAQHLAGLNHLKRVLMEKRATDTNDPTIEPSAELEETPNNKYYCATCKVTCSGLQPYGQHMLSRQHERTCKLLSQLDEEDDALCKSRAKRLKPDSTTPELSCDVCNIKTSGPENMDAHRAGKNHAKRVGQLNIAKLAQVEPPPAIGRKRKIDETKLALFCEVCQVDIPGPEGKLTHENGKKHLRNLKLQNLEVGLIPPSAKKANTELPLPQDSCDVCKVSEIGLKNIEHKKSTEHLNNLSLLKLNITEIVAEADVTPVLVEAYTAGALTLELDTEGED